MPKTTGDALALLVALIATTTFAPPAQAWTGEASTAPEKIAVLGDLSSARHVAVVVPGSDVDIARLSGRGEVMRRDPVVDAVRAFAVVGVVCGHWLVTALVADGDGMSIDSPLRWMPGFSPATWALQTLGLFFFAGGFAATRSRTGWFTRFRALVAPVAVVLGGWVVILAGLSMRGVPQLTLSSVAHLVITPLW